LEDFLDDFKGCLVIVSHDRYFMDRLVDHLLVFEGEGAIRDFPGNYSQYRAMTREEESFSSTKKQVRATTAVETEKSVDTPSGKKRFSYKEKREFEQLGKEIEALSERKRVIQQSLEQSDLAYEKIHSLSEELVQITNQLDEKELRWLELSEYTD
jgi:ATP-binding cassette subfamily F protein uup